MNDMKSHTMFGYAVTKRLPLLAILTALLFGMVQEGYGQRVYANVENHSFTPLLASVANPSRTINPDTTLYSELNVTVGLLGLVSAEQTVTFTNPPTNLRYSPIIVKFSTPGSLLDLLGGFNIHRVNNGNLVLPSYGGPSLLELLNLFGGGNIATLVIPPTSGTLYNGVKLTVNTTLGVGRTARFYYAFYITPAEVIENTITICESADSSITILNYSENYEAPYTYRLYDAQIDGNEVGVTTTTNSLTIPPNLPAGEYWLEAREDDFYPSGRIKITINRTPLPGRANLDIKTSTDY